MRIKYKRKRNWAGYVTAGNINDLGGERDARKGRELLKMVDDIKRTSRWNKNSWKQQWLTGHAI